MPRNKYPEETVEKILDASLELFLKKGFEQTTVLDIVDNLGGLTRGAFYHHFKTKEEVLIAIFDRDDSESTDDSFQKSKDAYVKNGLERVRLFIRYELLANIENQHQNTMSNLALPLLSNPRFLVELIKKNQKEAYIFVPFIEEGIADGSIKPCNPKIVAELGMLLVNFWLIPSIFPCEREESLAKIALLKQIFDGIDVPIIDDEIEGILFRLFDSINM
ncbi:MAG: TetR/AcrR family transcriptional regulator [Oscillospiraceae bacterium]|nr:TetR/AcrR family transcriptional regulator [Oscillospiraceae bacterium]